MIVNASKWHEIKHFFVFGRVRKWIIDTDGVCDDMARKSSKLNKNCTDHNICSKVPPGHQVRKCI